MKIFRLNRNKDQSGVSGTGVVAIGVEFPSGKVAVTWRGEKATIEIADSISVIEGIHGHEGSTTVEFIELPPRAAKYLEEFLAGTETKPTKSKRKKKDGKS